MDVLLIGGNGRVSDAIIDKLSKEGHKIYVLTGSQKKTRKNRKVFEQYNFNYDDDCIKEVFESINPDVTMFLGAYDTNFNWKNARSESTRYLAAIMNILIAFSLLRHGRFIYLSSEEVYGKSYIHDISEDEEGSADSFKAMAILQGEHQCIDYHEMMDIDTVVLRIDNLIYMPEKNKSRKELDICSRMCLDAVYFGRVSINKNRIFSMIYLSDAIECIYSIVSTAHHKYVLYNISSSNETNELFIAEDISKEIGKNIDIQDNSVGAKSRIVLSNNVYDEEFHINIYNDQTKIVDRLLSYMKKNCQHYMSTDNSEKNIPQKIGSKLKVIISAIIPFAENMVCFIPFFMLNNRAVGSQYFARFDFYLLYVLLFAIIYGQQQATFAALLATAGYCFRQMYTRTSLDVVLDYNTYVWIAQLFIVGLIVGYMKDRLSTLKRENEIEIEYLKYQLNDIQDINNSNTRIKNVLTTQIVNQHDSFGKIYDITSSLEKYESGEVLFYAAEVLSKLMKSKDVAIYTVANGDYARLFSSTSQKARQLGNSIKYTDFEEMYESLKNKKVYINKKMDDRYPLMANAIYSDDEMKLILMVWGIPWERMTLSQANMFNVIGLLIQNAVIRSNRYIEAFHATRYIPGTKVLEPDAFINLSKTYFNAKQKGLTECTILKVESGDKDYIELSKSIQKMLRQTDYMGSIDMNSIEVLLSNTSEKEADYVINRFKKAGYTSEIQEEVAQ